MPRRKIPDPLAQAVGERVRQLRKEVGLTQEKLAHESGLPSKGHLSDLEHGLAVPTVATLKTLADRLELELLDLVTFPDEALRQELVDRTRSLPSATIRRLLVFANGASDHARPPGSALAAEAPSVPYGGDRSPESPSLRRPPRR